MNWIAKYGVLAAHNSYDSTSLFTMRNVFWLCKEEIYEKNGKYGLELRD